MSKIELQDFVYIGKLLATYGNLLSDDRQKIMTEYFEYNMTLAEIAAERNISRQAVLDAIDKSCKKLKEYETALGICNKKDELIEKLTNLSEFTEELKIKEKVEQILKDL